MTDGLNESSVKSFIGAMIDPVMVLDARGQIVIQNAASRNLFGYALKDIVGKHFIDWSLASTYSVRELRSAKRSFSAAIKEDKGFALEYEFVTKKGKSVHVLLSGSMLKDPNNTTTHIMVLLRDITEQKKAGEALELQHRWLDGTLSSIGDAVIATDTEARVTFMNPVAENLTGWTTQEAMGQDIRKVFHIINELTRKAAENPVYRVLKEGITVGLANHTVLISRDGREIPIDDSGTPIKTSDGTTLGVVLIFRDITERRKAEWMIGERVKELTCLFDISDLTSELSVNAFVEGVVELIPPAWNYPEITCARIVLGDREFTTSNFRETSWKLAADIKVSGEQKNTVEVYYLEKRPDIDVGPFLKEERNLINTLAKTIGSKIERKRAEEALRDSEGMLDQIFKSSSIGIRVVDMDFNVLRINKSLAMMIGMSLEEVLGEKCYKVFSGPTCHTQECTLTRILSGEELVTVETEKETPEGVMIPCLLISTPYRDPNGNLFGIVESFIDITERKKMEWALAARFKEISCLLGVSEALRTPEKTLDEAFIEMTEIIRQGWQYPEVTCVRITHGNKKYETAGCKTTEWQMSSDIGMDRTSLGTIDVFYTEEKPEADKGPFLSQEFELITALGRQIGAAIERRRAEKALENSEQELALRNRIAQVFLTVTEDEVMYNEILKIALETLDSEFGVFGYIDENGAFVVPSMTRHIWNQCMVPQKRHVFPRATWGNSTWPRAVREKRTIHLNEFSTLTPEGHIPISRHISLPIIHLGDVIGLLQVANKRTEYDEMDILKLEGIAQDVAPILNARLQRDEKEEERKRVEEVLRVSEEQLSAFMDSATDAFFLWDSELNLLRVNPAGIKIISPQGEPEDIFGTNLRDITPDKSRIAIYEEVMRTGEPYFTTDIIQHPKFGNIHLNLKAFKVGESLGISTTDITELVQKERFAVLGQLGAGIGHDLRNPLGAIKNAVYFLRMVFEEPTPEVKETIDIIEKEVVSSERIINSLLSYTRPKPATRRKVDINAVIAAALSNVTIPEKVDVVSKLDEGISTILADPDQLQQVFVNLMLNAFQAMPKGGRLVVKSWSSGSDSVEVSIADTGIGISQENVSKIFNPLYTTKAKGIGLGLAIVKTLVDGHDGTIDVQSEPDKGTTFTVRIPISPEGVRIT